MKSITRQKPFEEIQEQLEVFDRVFIVGCGTCATVTETGGVEQVKEMSDQLHKLGKRITGSIVIPTTCDDMTAEVMKENKRAIADANAILVMSCALGVHRLNLYLDQPVIPALDTMFIAVEDTPGSFHEVCAQCGQCVLGRTAGICPITTCHKGLLNGPCGGTNDGKCEVDKEMDCAWTLIYNGLKEQDRLYLMKQYSPPHNFHVTPRPKVVKISERGD